ncbi:MAG: phage late control D family protein [Lachnospiraceae bacterium]|nr:phage late control D family protein [Lachnospiraceae bacterium]MBR2274543.1 phage late control D family protein [Lachnospiraceae bacterium]
MADFDFGDLKKVYEDFQFPVIQVEISGKDVTGDKEKSLFITRAEIEQTSGFEAGIATFSLVGAYDQDNRTFKIKDYEDFIYPGSPVIIYLGYAKQLREVFRGFIARVHFIIPRIIVDQVPSIEITAMDAKGLMMANRHSKKLKATCYSDAVKEVLKGNAFLTQKNNGKDFTTLNISDTPDKQENQGKTGDFRVEMVEESDYEFIVKAAKKFNFEFFIVGETLYFIEAKKNKTPLMTLTPFSGMQSMDVGYDISGLVNSVEVRNINMEEGAYVGNKKKAQTKLALGNKAKPLIEKQSFVYLDPSVKSKQEAEHRASYLMESIDYRLGSVSAEFIGIPELTAGRFLTLDGFGKPLNNDFYLTRVRHILDGQSYRTEIEGSTNTTGK